MASNRNDEITNSIFFHFPGEQYHLRQFYKNKADVKENVTLNYTISNFSDASDQNWVVLHIWKMVGKIPWYY